ncbi:S-layer homology domain-containing protein [Paenibacillus sp. YN15]|uniref:S-layer homology domain-containing protein n=1 Tax=Paenibacillus sp. YN15 TaxID=1742774 RepID=UPI000DCB4A14|nr:S-layer homology domain-containing protein [Paenibacillus sp. YN15]RAV03468.1 S-layer protein [Paenibacillus sp. YN15]
MKIKVAVLMCCLFLMGMSGVFGAAANQAATFGMTGGESGLEVVITAQATSDVYAYELNLTFDEGRLELEKAEAPHNGFLVNPLVEGERIRIAHTLIGPKQGLKGDIQLAVLRFKRLAPGPAEVVLKEVKLVDASIESAVFTPLLKTELTAEAPGLADIEGHWAEQPIREAVRRGIVTGYEDGTFRPERPVTRAEFAVLLVRALGLEGDSSPQPAFADAGDIPAWAAPSVAAIAEAGLIQGYEDGTFGPGRQISRTEMTVMLVRALGLEPDQALELQPFADKEQIPGWAWSSIAAAVEAGIIQGTTGNRFAPEETATRAEAVAAIMNLVDRTER